MTISRTRARIADSLETDPASRSDDPLAFLGTVAPAVFHFRHRFRSTTFADAGLPSPRIKDKARPQKERGVSEDSGIFLQILEVKLLGSCSESLLRYGAHSI